MPCSVDFKIGLLPRKHMTFVRVRAKKDQHFNKKLIPVRTEGTAMFPLIPFTGLAIVLWDGDYMMRTTDLDYSVLKVMGVEMHATAGLLRKFRIMWMREARHWAGVMIGMEVQKQVNMHRINRGTLSSVG